MKKIKYKTIFLTTLFELFTVAISFACIFIIKEIVDNINIQNKSKNILYYFIVILSVYLLSFLFSSLSIIISNNLSVRFKNYQSRKMYSNFLKMNYLSIIEKQPTYLADRIFNSIETYFLYYSSVAKDYIINSLLIIVCLSFAYYYSYILGIVLTIIIPIYILSYILLNKKLQKKSIILQTKNSKSFANVISIINEVDYYKQLDNYEPILDIIDNNIKNVNRENAKVTIFAQMLSNLISKLLDFSNSLFYVIISIIFVKGDITLSSYVFITMILNMLFPAVSSIIKANLSLRDLKASNDFYQREILNNLEIDGSKQLDSIETIKFNISSFSYGSNNLLENINLEIKKSDKIFLSGLSGSGKTTLIKGLLKFINMESIQVNGVDIKDYNNSSYRSKFVFLSQNLPIIPGTLENNILFGKSAELEFLKNKKFMKKFYDSDAGLKQEIYDNGSNLSGGDKQKIALARLYLSDAEVIILDETINAIDYDSKMDILETLFTDFKDKIIIMISHELSLKKYFDYHYQICDKTLIKKE